MIHPAYLWIGQSQQLYKAAQDFIKETICSKKGCGTCRDCRLIEQKQHYLVRWLEPENYYTMVQLEVIFKTIVFALQPEEHFFFVIERANLLTHICANSLLKSLEEPPPGYHFLLLAQRSEGILPTISSRCIIEHFDNTYEQKHPLFNFFINFQPNHLTEFSKELERTKILERDIADLLDQLYSHWSDCFKMALNKGAINLSPIKDDTNLSPVILSEGAARVECMQIERCQKMIALLDNIRNYPPMPGSAKIFLRNLFLQCIVLNQEIKS